MFDSLQTFLLRRARAAVIAGLAVCVVVSAAVPVFDLPLHVSRNYNEGWNAVHAQAAMRGGPLYPGAGALTFNNYPPLSFYVTGLVGELTGDALIAGRGISLLCLLAVALAAVSVTRSITGSTSAALLAGGLLLANMATWFTGYVAINDPQMLGHALQYSGLAWLVARGRGRGVLLGTLGLVVLGGLVKQSLLPVPLGITLWLLATNRRDFVLWSFAAGLTTLLVTGGLILAFGEPLLVGILQHQRTFELYSLGAALELWLLPLMPLLVAGFAAWRLGAGDSRVSLLAIIAALAGGIGVATAAGEGVAFNAIFDLLFAAAILAAIGIHQITRITSERPNLGWIAPLCTLAVAAHVFVIFPAQALRAKEALEARPVRARQYALDLQLVRESEGPVLTADAALSYWAGKPYLLDFFNYGQRLRVGGADGTDLIARIERREFGLIQVEDPGGSERLVERVNAAIRHAYRIGRESPVSGVFYVPRP